MQYNHQVSILLPEQPGFFFRDSRIRTDVCLWNPLVKKNLGCFFEFTTGANDEVLQLVPDNCLSFYFFLNDAPEGFIAGPHTSSKTINLPAHTTILIFKPLTILKTKFTASFSQDSIEDVYPLDIFFKNSPLLAKLTEAHGYTERKEIFLSEARKHLLVPQYGSSKYGSDLVDEMQLLICRTKGQKKVKYIAQKMGYSERYCHLLFNEAIGMSLKLYSEVIRFQNVIKMFFHQTTNFLEVALANNLHDQAHLYHVVKRFTSYAPSEYLRTFYKYENFGLPVNAVQRDYKNSPEQGESEMPKAFQI
ncbi:MAG: helix-turn-helix domain-containing protein [Deltaproteobacteria bacterium]|jgi:AraC-like DNA-binding protein|nr:helix-turn-helix domain-containing protein [Deltaproteobacteria bacterium]